jgi:hypothetical protein
MRDFMSKFVEYSQLVSSIYDAALLKVTTRDFGEMVEVRVRDNGTGIAPRSGTGCFSRLSRQSRPAKARASACR